MRAAVTAVDHLASLLAPAVRLGALAMPKVGDIDAVIEALQRRIQSGSAHPVAADLQHETVRRFWRTPHLETLKDARLVAFGLNLPVGPEGACILDDRSRLDATLQGVDQWLHDARWYRRGYQGLVWSYFNCEIDAPGAGLARRQNWLRLRDYLSQRAPRTVDPVANPDWVRTVICHRHLFGDTPCERHVADLLRGDHGEVDAICQRLGIGGTSWFLRRLVHGQVTAAANLGHEAFRDLLPRLIELLASAPALRNPGLACLLERYHQIPQPQLHEALRDAAADWWGSPWLPANELHWSGVKEGVRSMVSQWHKAALIDRFFAEPDDERGSRRAAFWKRYVKSIRTIEFAFGGNAMQASQSRARIGPERVVGCGTCLIDGSHAARALVMRMGRAVVVEFSDPSIPVHGYDLGESEPFDMSRPVVLAPDADNSLRQSHRSLNLPHQDGLHGWRQWEQMFEAAISDRFDIRPGSVPSVDGSPHVDLSDSAVSVDICHVEPLGRIDAPRWQTASASEDVHWLTAEAASVPYSRADLEVLARVHALHIEDETKRTGRLWVRTDATDHRIARVLTGWGFEQVAGAGWRR
ncbi:MAG: EH signature domain-containing protein [Rhizobacter sp.]